MPYLQALTGGTLCASLLALPHGAPCGPNAGFKPGTFARLLLQLAQEVGEDWRRCFTSLRRSMAAAQVSRCGPLSQSLRWLRLRQQVCALQYLCQRQAAMPGTKTVNNLT